MYPWVFTCSMHVYIHAYISTWCVLCVYQFCRAVRKSWCRRVLFFPTMRADQTNARIQGKQDRPILFKWEIRSDDSDLKIRAKGPWAANSTAMAKDPSALRTSASQTAGDPMARVIPDCNTSRTKVPLVSWTALHRWHWRTSGGQNDPTATPSLRLSETPSPQAAEIRCPSTSN